MKKSVIFLSIILIALIVGVVGFTRFAVMGFQDAANCINDEYFYNYYRNQAIMHIVFAIIQFIGAIIDGLLIISAVKDCKKSPKY